MSKPVDSEIVAMMHSLALGFLTHMLLAIDLPQLYRRHEQEKKREYNQQFLEVDKGVFTPVIFSTSGGMGRESTVFYKGLADYLSRKRDLPYSVTMGWLRCYLNFAFLRSAILCIRGSRSSKQHP